MPARALPNLKSPISNPQSGPLLLVLHLAHRPLQLVLRSELEPRALAGVDVEFPPALRGAAEQDDPVGPGAELRFVCESSLMGGGRTMLLPTVHEGFEPIILLAGIAGQVHRDRPLQRGAAGKGLAEDEVPLLPGLVGFVDPGGLFLTARGQDEQKCGGRKSHASFPRMSREITIRWISLVPSPISQSFASR